MHLYKIILPYEQELTQLPFYKNILDSHYVQLI